MTRELTLYCDESDISGKHYSNFYGGALVESKSQAEVVDRLQAKKLELNLGAELKWQKISEHYAEKYIHFLDEAFELMGEGKLKIRIMFTHNYVGAARLSKEQRENSFFRLYYQFVKHGFGFGHSAMDESVTRLRIYFDKLPDNEEKCSAFKGYVLGLNKNREFRRAKVQIGADQIAEVDSKEHVVMQALDVVMGAMQFRLNDKHLEKPEGSMHRGKRTIAKERVYKHVSSKVRALYPGFNIGISTGKKNDPRNIWLDAYRHWVFKPADFELKPEYVKKK